MKYADAGSTAPLTPLSSAIFAERIASTAFAPSQQLPLQPINDDAYPDTDP